MKNQVRGWRKHVAAKKPMDSDTETVCTVVIYIYRIKEKFINKKAEVIWPISLSSISMNFV